MRGFIFYSASFLVFFLPPHTQTLRILYLNIRHLHAGAFFAHKDVIYIHQDVTLQGHREPLPGEKGHSVHKHQLVQPEGQVVAKQDPLDAVMEPQVLHHRREQSGVLPYRRNALRRLGLGQQHGLVRRVVGLENGPVVAGEGAWQGLPRSSDEEQRGLWVDRAVLQAQVRVKEEREAFQLCTEQTVFIGLVTRQRERDGEMREGERKNITDSSKSER